MKKVVIFLVLCALACAFVPRNRRAVEDGSTPSLNYCGRFTPCAWKVYDVHPDKIISFIENSYCVCAPDLTCRKVDNDEASKNWVHYCRADNETLHTEPVLNL